MILNTSSKGSTLLYVTVTNDSSEWTKDDSKNWYTRSIELPGIRSCHNPDIDIVKGANKSDTERILEAYNSIIEIKTTETGILVISDSIPAVNFTIKIKVD